jgi:hypothetical protein
MSSTQNYPPAPWNLQGYGFLAIQLLDIDNVSAFVPIALDIIPILPGKTLGGLYVATYPAESTLLYNELIIVSAIVRYKTQIGAWISHIYVDHPGSVAGGREIWGLPKEMAQFDWQGDRSAVQVYQHGKQLCGLKNRWLLPGWTQPIAGSVFSELDGKLEVFTAQSKLKWQLASLEVEVSSESPFAALGFSQTWGGFYFNPLQVTVQAPVAIDTH